MEEHVVEGGRGMREKGSLKGTEGDGAGADRSGFGGVSEGGKW